MRRVTPLLAVAVFVAACADVPTGPSEELAPFNPQLGANVVYGSYIVVLKDGANPRSVAAIAGVRPNHVYEAALNGFSAELNQGQLNALRRNPNVAYVDADAIASIPTPRAEAKPGGGGGGGQQVPWGITRVGGAGDGTGRTAWVLDTGIDFAHADLNVDVNRSRDFTGSRDGAIDQNGHGTHVAGTIAAKNNTIDVVGVAAGATVVAVRVLDRRGSGAWSWIIAGIDYVAANGGSGDVANMSLSGPVTASVDQAVANAAQSGVKFVLAAGNDGHHANNNSPARTNGTNIYTVSAISSSGCMPSWSNYGNPPVDWAAPGASVLSTRRGGGTTSMSGTSMAAPHVAGILLLGAVRADGNATCDPDGNPDPIAHR